MDLFREEVSQALASLQQEFYRLIDWLENDRPNYWRGQVQLDFNRIAEARTRLAACKRRTVGDHRPSCIEEVKELEQAKRKLQYDQEKVELVRNWRIRFQREFEEYQGQISQMHNYLAGDIPRSSALLIRILSSLESYADLAIGNDDRRIETSAAVEDEKPEEKPENTTRPRKKSR
jgi:hypothetical protein